MTIKNYLEFVHNKVPVTPLDGITDIKLPRVLKPFQRAAVSWAVRRRRSALFAGTGLGKTLQQLCWAQAVCKHEQGQALILTPLAVAEQTVREAKKFGIADVMFADTVNGCSKITVTNYDRAEAFANKSFSAVVLDESSIIKHENSKTRAALTEQFKNTSWKLCCTATPAPNDFVEIGNHSEFLGALDMAEMLATFFVHEGAIRAGEAEEDWRMKRHAENDFWQWMSTWALVYNKPGDLGFSDPEYELPELRRHLITVEALRKPAPGCFFPSGKMSLQERAQVRKQTAQDRVAAAATLINADRQSSWLVWCGLNEEAALLETALADAQQVSGSMLRGLKQKRLLGFVDALPRVLITKPSIAGFGMNWQHCHKMVFVGLNDSFEQLYQAIRRCWRFGQNHPVDVYVISSTAEGAVLDNIINKERKVMRMYSRMLELSKAAVSEEGQQVTRIRFNPTQEVERLPTWLRA